MLIMSALQFIDAEWAKVESAWPDPQRAAAWYAILEECQARYGPDATRAALLAVSRQESRMGDARRIARKGSDRT
jgi:hypothetical protein